MSKTISEKMEEHQEDIAKESEKVQELMTQTSTGSDLMESSTVMASSDEMQDLMGAIDDPQANEQDKFLMGKYMGQMLQTDPANGLMNYANYLRDVAANPDYADRKVYFSSIAEAAVKLHKSTVFQDYVVKYNAFEADESPEAEQTRRAMEEMSEKMRQWIEGDEAVN
tara:strand:- start:320 stop:823 length:504 start_codon:yes stop_codon:yes gene_type:complete